MINQNVYMPITYRIFVENLILFTIVMVLYLVLTGKLKITSTTTYKVAKMDGNATCAMAGKSNNIIHLITKP
jgi:hypothetical protein